jgi:hypothetical protein
MFFITMVRGISLIPCYSLCHCFSMIADGCKSWTGSALEARTATHCVNIKSTSISKSYCHRNGKNRCKSSISHIILFLWTPRWVRHVENKKYLILYICILLHIVISLSLSLSLSLFLSVFCAACQCFETLFSVLNTCHF